MDPGSECRGVPKTAAAVAVRSQLEAGGALQRATRRPPNAEVSCMTESEYTLLFLSTEASLLQRGSCQLHRDVRRDPLSFSQTVHIPFLQHLTAIV